MPRPKKEARYLNVYIQKDLHDRFEEFCKKLGQSKTVAAERALKMYMDAYEGGLDKIQEIQTGFWKPETKKSERDCSDGEIE